MIKPAAVVGADAIGADAVGADASERRSNYISPLVLPNLQFAVFRRDILYVCPKSPENIRKHVIMRGGRTYIK